MLSLIAAKCVHGKQLKLITHMDITLGLESNMVASIVE
jgi:hypothetical protein